MKNRLINACAIVTLAVMACVFYPLIWALTSIETIQNYYD